MDETLNAIARAHELLARSGEAADCDAADRLILAFVEQARQSSGATALVALLTILDLLAEDSPEPPILRLAVMLSIGGIVLADTPQGRTLQ